MTEEQHALFESYIAKYGTPLKVMKTVHRNMYLAAVLLGHDEDDIEQHGLLAVAKAAELFDQTRGSFHTYANWRLKHCLSNLIDYSNEKCRNPPNGYLVRDNDDDPEAWQLGYVEDHKAECPHARMEREEIRQVVQKLPWQERTVVHLRFGLGGRLPPLNRIEIGSQIGVSAERVRIIELKATDRLRRMLA